MDEDLYEEDYDLDDDDLDDERFPDGDELEESLDEDEDEYDDEELRLERERRRKQKEEDELALTAVIADDPIMNPEPPSQETRGPGCALLLAILIPIFLITGLLILKA